MSISLEAIDGFARERWQEGVRYFFPDSRLEVLEPGDGGHRPPLAAGNPIEGAVEFEWRGTRYVFARTGGPVTAFEQALLASIARVLSARADLLGGEPPAADTVHLVRGLPEDRYVAAFLEALTVPDVVSVDHRPDRITEAVEVLRASALGTYENRRIAMGVLLFGSQADPCHDLPPLPAGAIRYTRGLTTIRSFRRLSDGLQTVALVNTDGLLVEIVDVRTWAQPFAEQPLPVPCATPFQAHARATLCGGHLCLVLTPAGEIKIFAEGIQMFSFLDGRWRLTDPVEKYRSWAEAIGDPILAERLFAVALNLAEERRGGLLLVLDDPRLADRLVSPADLLDTLPLAAEETIRPGFKKQLHYLFDHKPVLDVSPTVLETLARIDGAIVIDREANLLAFGAILQHSSAPESVDGPVEGGRTTAALAASRFGNVLKVSEDGVVSFFRAGHCVWEL